MKKVEMTVYVTTDGKQFFEKENAEKHEKTICNTKVYRIRYAPDLTETGYLTKAGYITVQSRWNHNLWADHWAYKQFGDPVAFVQGVSPTRGWTVEEVSLDEVEKDKLMANLNKL